MKPEYDFSTGERGRFFHADARLHLPAGDVSPAWAEPDEGPAPESRETARESRLTAAQESAPQNHR